MALDFGDDTVALGEGDRVILAVPAANAVSLLPGLRAPDDFRAIVNAHYAFPRAQNPAFADRGDRRRQRMAVRLPRPAVGDHFGRRAVSGDAARGTGGDDLGRGPGGRGFKAPLPAWQILKEKRATFAATPAQDALRPATKTRWSNLALAGDWTQTGLPATIEGAIRSGVKAARSSRSAAGELLQN